MTFRFAALSLAPLAFGVSLASAADLGSMRTMHSAVVASDSYVVTVTANGQIMPTYPGADSLTGLVYPSINIRRADEPARFTAPDDGFSISVLEDPTFRIGPVARIQDSRSFNDNRRLFGLRRVPVDVEPGAFVEYWPVSFIRARVELRHGTRDDIGLVGNAGVDFIAPYGQFTFSLGPRLNFADANYMKRYFGVRPTESAVNPLLTTFRPGAGIVSAGVLGSVTYQWNERWATTGYVGYNRLVDDAARSPITRRAGTADQLTFGASISYSFNFTPGVGITER